MDNTEKPENKSDNSMLGEKSILNVDAQKELINYRIKQSVKLLLITFPIVGIFVCGLLYVIFKLVHLI